MFRLVGGGVAAALAFMAVFAVVLSPPWEPAVANTGAVGGEYAPSDEAKRDIPSDTLALYQAAARTCSGMDWAVLAGVGKIETNHGRSDLPGVKSGQNSAGAMGPMQFLQGTWDANKTPAPGHTTPSIYDIGDAIYSAAKYLCSNGGGAGLPTADQAKLHNALWHYNHSEQYISDVLAQATKYRGAWVPASGPASGPGQPGNPMPSCKPAITQGYGPGISLEPPAHGFPHFHGGVDLACTQGTVVKDIEYAGKAHVTMSNLGYGNHVDVEIQSPQGHFYARYAHLAAVAVSDGATVQVGDVIGWEGSTGASTGPHLHFGVYQNGLSENDTIDPSGWLAL